MPILLSGCETWRMMPSFTRGTRPTAPTPWLACTRPKPDAPYRLVNFAATGNRGGTGSDYSSRKPEWAALLPEFEVYDVLLPGRGARFGEPLPADAAELVRDLSHALIGALEGGKPYAFLGHAFGAVLAFEVALEIFRYSMPCGARNQLPTEGPALLVAVSSEGPTWPGRNGTLGALDDGGFEAALRERGGTEEILADPELTELFLPVIKRDVAIEEGYLAGSAAAGHRRVNVATLAVHGAKPGRDPQCSRVSHEQAKLWMDASVVSHTINRVVTLLDHDWHMLEDEAGAAAVLEVVDLFFRDCVEPVLRMR